MDTSIVEKLGLYDIVLHDASIYGLCIGKNRIKIRFSIGTFALMYNDALKPLFVDSDGDVVLDLTLYGIKNLKTTYYSQFDFLDCTVIAFDEREDGELYIDLICGDSIGGITLQFGYDDYKWEHVKSYADEETPDEAETERLADDLCNNFDFRL